MIHILDRQTERILDVLVNQSDRKIYWDTKMTEAIEDNVLIFEFRMLADSPAAKHIIPKNKLTAQDQDGFHRLFIIDSVETTHDANGKILFVSALGDHIELASEEPISPQTLAGQTAETAVKFVLANTRYQPGQIDFAGSRTITFDTYTNPLAALQKIASVFDLELRFRVTVNPDGSITRIVDLLKPDSVFDGKEIVFGKDMTGIRRKENTENICTRLVGIGPADEDGNIVTFASVNGGKIYVEDEEAFQRWNNAGRHIWGIFEYQPEEGTEVTPQQLLDATKKEMEKRKNSAVEWEVQAAALEQVIGLEHERVRVGMNVRIKDEAFDPPIYLEARVLETEMPELDDPNGNFSYKFGNYREVQVSTPEDIKRIQKMLFQNANNWKAKAYKVEYYAPDGLDFDDGSTQKRIIVRVYNGKQEITSLLDASMFVWEKISPDGTYDEAWAEAHRGIGNVITVGREVIGCTIRCKIDDGNLPSIAVYFLNGINYVVNQLSQVQTGNTLSILFITDTHYATGSKNGINLKSRSTLHLQNAAYLTQKVNIDLVVHGGDLIDGDEPKNLMMTDLQDAAIALFEYSNAPIIFVHGNHDDNSWYAHDDDGNLMRSVIHPAERYAILSKYMDPAFVQNPSEKELLYGYKDFPNQKIRIICLNSFDNPYIMNADGTNKYPSMWKSAFRQNQLNWLANTALKLPDSSWGVLIFSHAPLQGTFSSGSQVNSDILYGILSAFMNGATYTGTSSTTDYEVNVSCDFRSQGPGEIIAVISGHIHYDSDMSKNGMKCIQTLNSLARNDYPGQMPDRQILTLSEDAWDVFTIDRSKRKIYATRFGAGSSREFSY